jgi:signal transduction histidine kinase
MNKSIALRSFLIIISGQLISLCAVLAFAWWGLEELEITMLNAESETELDFFQHRGDKQHNHRIQTAQLISVFQLHSVKDSKDLPVVFHNVPVPFKGEVEVLGKEYMVLTYRFDEGTYYVAKSLHLFEQREAQMIKTMLYFSLFLIAAAVAHAVFVSRLISKPIVSLSRQIHTLDPNLGQANRISTEYRDKELQLIAAAINNYLQQVDSLVERERMLIAMASHELRTPIAVVTGAASVIERREQLEPDDKKTLARIIKASQEMKANVNALLSLARQGSESDNKEVFLLAETIDGLYQDYKIQAEELAHRITLKLENPTVSVTANKALVRILLNNLITNSLNHTSGEVIVSLHEQWLDVCDSDPRQIENQGEGWQFDGNTSPGLGLYIVRLACERLGWRYEIASSRKSTRVRILFT